MTLLRRFKSSSRSRSRWKRGRAWLIRLAVWGGIPVFIVLGLFFSGVGLERLFHSRNPHFTLRKIEIKVALGALEPETLLPTLGLRRGVDNLYGLKLGKLRRKLLQHPMIQQAEVRRILPDTIHVTIYGRTPVAQLLKRGGRLVDGSGWVMPPTGRNDTLNLPIITGVAGVMTAPIGARLRESVLEHALEFLKHKAAMPRGAWLAVKLVQCSQQHGELIVYLNARPERGIRPNATLRLPAADLERALTNTLDVLEARAQARQSTSAINATNPRRIPVTP